MSLTCCIRAKDELQDCVRAWVEACRIAKPDRLDDVFVLQRWLSTAAATKSLSLPCSIDLSEKPDFVLSQRDGKVGIECTRFLAEQRARAARIANEKGVWHTPTVFDFDSPRRGNSEIAGMVGQEPPGLTGWRSIPDMLTLYESKLGEILVEKTRKGIVQSTQPCSSYWLVVEDQHFLSPFDLYHLEQMAMTRLAAYWRTGPAFDAIFFVSLTDPQRTLVFQKDTPTTRRTTTTCPADGAS